MTSRTVRSRIFNFITDILLLLHSVIYLKTVNATKPLNQEKDVIGNNSMSELNCLQSNILEVGICNKPSF